MKLSPNEIEKIATRILVQFEKDGLVIKDHAGAKQKIEAVIGKNLKDERNLEDDAEKLMKQHMQAAGGSLDQTKVLRMIKDKLAKERKFVL